MITAAHPTLSARQAEIADLVVSGKSSREIAAALSLSARTVETHIGAIFDKMGVSSRAELLIAVLGSGSRKRAEPAPAIPARGNLPLAPVDLIGRADDIAHLIELLRDYRLVTLTGAGGIGKTRLAIAVAQTLLAASPANSVWLVDLAPLAPGSAIDRSIAQLFDVATPRDTPVIDMLCAAIGVRAMAIVLDNCEHLIGEAAAVASALLSRCPALRIIATSREPLRIATERAYRLDSLRSPAPREATLDRELGRTYSAIDLFAQRARAADHRFRLTNDNVGSVADICRRLDGIPLAIELAAARVRILSLPALAATLNAHLRILSGGDRTAIPRHRTMHALIDWSYDLLSDAEQRVFERLSVFAGGCTLREAAIVCGDAQIDELAVLELLSSLVDKSLVLADVSTSEPRYGQLRTFAQYAEGKLAERGERHAAMRRHAQAYTALAEQLDREYDLGPVGATWYERLYRDLENWRAALHWTLEIREDVGLGQRLTVAMSWILFTIGGWQWARKARELVDDATPPLLAAHLEFLTARVAMWTGQYAASADGCVRAIAAYHACESPRGVARAQGTAAAALATIGRLDEAESFNERAYENTRSDQGAAWWARGSPLELRAHLAFRRGDYASAREYYARHIAMFEELGAHGAAAQDRVNLADFEFAAGNVDEAVALATKALSALRVIEPKNIRAHTLALGCNNMATYCIALGRWEEARAYAAEAIEIVRYRQYRLQIIYALQHIAACVILPTGAFSRLDADAAAVRLLGYINSAMDAAGVVRETNEQREFERIMVALEANLAAGRLGALMDDGAKITQDRAIELAQHLIQNGPAGSGSPAWPALPDGTNPL